MTNENELQTVIDSSGISISFISEKLGISRSAFYKKMRNETEFKASEIAKITEVLHLTDQQRDAIFFAA